MSKPIRMCIVCRQRYPQSTLIRLQCKDRELTSYTKMGRSFYICHECKDTKIEKTAKIVARHCTKSVDFIKDKLEEIITDG